MRKILAFTTVVLISCGSTGQLSGESKENKALQAITAEVHMLGGLVPPQYRHPAPLILLDSTGQAVFLVQHKDKTCSYYLARPSQSSRLLRIVNKLWESGLSGSFSQTQALDLASLSIKLHQKAGSRTLNVYGYGMGKPAKGLELVDSLMTWLDQQKDTSRPWTPSALLLYVEEWTGQTRMWRVEEWELEDFDLSEHAQNPEPALITGQQARELLRHLRGKTVFFTKDMALFRQNGKLYSVAMVPTVMPVQ